MNEHPVFVPWDGQHLATVLTVPDAEPDGLMLLMTGLGAHRSHRFGIWTRAARLLADRRIASIRFDYRGVGESTGVLGVWHMADIPVGQAMAVMRFGMAATGARRVAAAGNCGGAWTALLLGARMPECAGVAFIRAPVLAPVERGRLAHRASRSTLGKVVRSNRVLRATARAVLNRGARRGLDLSGPHTKVLDRGRILYLFGEEDYGFNDSVRGDLARLDERLSSEQRTRYELRVIPGRTLQGFESLETQQLVIDAIVGWTTELFAGAGAEVPAATAP